MRPMCALWPGPSSRFLYPDPTSSDVPQVPFILMCTLVNLLLRSGVPESGPSGYRLLSCLNLTGGEGRWPL